MKKHIYFFLLILFIFSAERILSADLEVAVLDVGQAESIYLRLPNSKNVLIDAGSTNKNHIVDFLKSQGVDTLAALVLTHPHSDHIGYAKDIINNFEVEKVYDPGADHPLRLYKSVLEKILEKKLKYIQPRSGDMLNWDTNLQIKTLHPARADYRKVNNNSIVIKLVYNKISFLFTGDAEYKAEKQMLKNFPQDLKATVLKVGHHGSRSSTKPDFLKAVSPEYALISCGLGNHYGHPHASVWSALRNNKIKIFRTDIHGNIYLKTNGETLSIHTQKKYLFPIAPVHSAIEPLSDFIR